MIENDPLSKYNKIPFDPNRPNVAVYFKISFKVEICSRYSIIPCFIPDR